MALALSLSACTVQPLYGPTPAGSLVQAALPAIAIAPADDRVEQEVRNRLIFAFTGGGAAAPALYDLSLSTSVSDVGLGSTLAGVAFGNSLRVTVTYVLTEKSAGRVVARATLTAAAAYERSNQSFANLRARRDAEDRAAASVADQIRTAIAVALATGA